MPAAALSGSPAGVWWLCLQEPTRMGTGITATPSSGLGIDEHATHKRPQAACGPQAVCQTHDLGPQQSKADPGAEAEVKLKPQALLAWPAATIRGEPVTPRLEHGRVHTLFRPFVPPLPRRQRGRRDPTHDPPAKIGPSAGRWQECGLSMHHPIVGWPKTFLVHSHTTPRPHVQG